MLAFGAIAYPLFLVMVATQGSLERPAAVALSVGAHLAYLICLSSLALFTRIVFRRESYWGFIAVGVTVLINAIGSGLTLSVSLGNLEGSYSMAPAVRWGGALISASFALVFLWASIEAFIYLSALRKRLALGLADPVVVNRFSIWVLGTGAAFLIDVALVLSNGIGLDPATNPLPALLQSASGLVCTLTWALTFAPSDAYLNWVRRRTNGVA